MGAPVKGENEEKGRGRLKCHFFLWIKSRMENRHFILDPRIKLMRPLHPATWSLPIGSPGWVYSEQEESDRRLCFLRAFGSKVHSGEEGSGPTGLVHLPNSSVQSVFPSSPMSREWGLGDQQTGM